MDLICTFIFWSGSSQSTSTVIWMRSISGAHGRVDIGAAHYIVIVVFSTSYGRRQLDTLWVVTRWWCYLMEGVHCAVPERWIRPINYTVLFEKVGKTFFDAFPIFSVNVAIQSVNCFLAYFITKINRAWFVLHGIANQVIRTWHPPHSWPFSRMWLNDQKRVFKSIAVPGFYGNQFVKVWSFQNQFYFGIQIAGHDAELMWNN